MLGVEHRGDDVDERHLGHDRPPAVGSLAEDRALEQPAGAQAAGGEPGAVDQAVEPVGHCEVVGEGVLLVLQPALEPPAPAALATAPHVGVHEDHAAVEQARQGGVPVRLVDRLVGAVAVEQCGGGAVERGVAVPHQGHRDAVPSGAGNVASRRRRRRVVAGRRPAVPLGALPGAQVDVGPDRRLHVGLVDTVTRCVVVLVGAGSRVPAGKRGSSTPGPVEVVERQDPQPVPTAGAQAQHHVAGERVDPLQPLGRVLRPHRVPGEVAWSASRGTGQRASRNSWASSLVTSSSGPAVGESARRGTPPRGGARRPSAAAQGGRARRAPTPRWCRGSPTRTRPARHCASRAG